MRERELAAYMKTLTPEDIKRENAFRTAQRRAGKSRKGNIKDPNAPKKPLSAYFMFLQRIRSDPDLVKEVFGDETETTKQSVLAAGKWRSMTDEERKVGVSENAVTIDYQLIHLITSLCHVAVPRTSRTGEAGIRSREKALRGGHDRVRDEYQLQYPAQ